MNKFKNWIMEHITYTGKLLLRTMAIAFCWTFIIFVFLLLGPIVEGKYMPVVTDVDLSFVHQGKDHIEIVFEGTKIRTCQFIEVASLIGPKENVTKGNIVFGDNENRGSVNRAPGRQFFGPWKIYPVGDSVTVVAYHRCHPLWQTVTPLIHWEAK